jgi:hypothetical protein
MEERTARKSLFFQSPRVGIQPRDNYLCTGDAQIFLPSVFGRAKMKMNPHFRGLKFQNIARSFQLRKAGSEDV